MAAGSAVRVLAGKIGPGGTGALVVFVLILACIAIFLALIGSLRRLRQRVSDGTFNAQRQSDARESGAVTRDPGDQGGADV